MGGPSSIVIVETEPGPQERLKLEEVLQRLGTRQSPTEDWPSVWIETTKPIGGIYSGEGLPFGVSWVVGELYEGEDEDHPTWRSDVATHFGIAPRARIVLSAGCDQPDDHRVLGELTLHLATAFSGVVDFGGALMVLDEPTPRQDALRWLQWFAARRLGRLRRAARRWSAVSSMSRRRHRWAGCSNGLIAPSIAAGRRCMYAAS